MSIPWSIFWWWLWVSVLMVFLSSSSCWIFLSSSPSRSSTFQGAFPRGEPPGGEALAGEAGAAGGTGGLAGGAEDTPPVLALMTPDPMLRVREGSVWL